MNKRGHVLNAILLAIGIGYILKPAGDIPTFEMIAEVSLPVVLGALFPDVDTAFGRHRKTLHNLPVLALFVAWPSLFGNLKFVWIGVLTHYVLDLLGSKRGIALFYPYEKEFDVPFGVPVSSKYSDLMTVFVTAVELAAVFAIVRLDLPVTDLTRSITIAIGL
ncbi:MAG: metal-dependent hydrolase [Halobacteriales archaeon]